MKKPNFDFDLAQDSVLVLDHSEVDLLTTPLDGSTESFKDILEKRKERRESFEKSCNAIQPQQQAQSLKVFKRGDAFFLYFDVWDIYCWARQANAVQIWLRSLSETDRVYIHCKGTEFDNLKNGDFFYFSSFINTLFCTKAKTIFSVDYFIRGISSYIALACEEICFTRFSKLSFSNPIPHTLRDPVYTSFQTFVDMLLEKAIKDKILTEEDVTNIKGDLSVTVSHQDLLTRLGNNAVPT